MNLLEKVATLIAFSIKVYLKCNLNILQSSLIALTQAESFTNEIHNARMRLDIAKPQILKDSSTNQLRPFTLTKINDIKGKAVKNWHWS